MMSDRDEFETFIHHPDHPYFMEDRRIRAMIYHTWQASREAVESEAVAWLWVVNGHRAVVPKDYADELIEDGETVLPLYTHPAISDNQAHWSQGSPGLADQYRQEAFAAREALGFSCDSLEVSPADIRQAIADKQAVYSLVGHFYNRPSKGRIGIEWCCDSLDDGQELYAKQEQGDE